jgi:hypothetical protein
VQVVLLGHAQRTTPLQGHTLFSCWQRTLLLGHPWHLGAVGQHQLLLHRPSKLLVVVARTWMCLGHLALHSQRLHMCKVCVELIACKHCGPQLMQAGVPCLWQCMQFRQCCPWT